MNNKLSVFSRIGCWIIGWNPEILKECGEASFRTLRKFMSAMLILAIIWGTIGYFFAQRYIGIESIIGSAVVAFTFILIIFSIERFIILTVGKNIPTIISRAILALLMALLGATIFDQIIFKYDVDMKMKEVRTEQINLEIPKRMSHIQEDINRTTLVIDSIGKANILLYESLAKKPTISVSEVSRTTKVVGEDEDGNPIKRVDTTVNNRAVDNPLSAQVKANEKALDLYKVQLENLQNKKMSIAEDVRISYEQAQGGFLEELKALISIVSSDLAAGIFYLVLLLFLLALELLIVMSKFGDKKCDYDLTIEHQLAIKADRLRNTMNGLMNKKDGQ